jgi:nucleoside-specific outer membrane channel protein Tsx
LVAIVGFPVPVVVAEPLWNRNTVMLLQGGGYEVDAKQQTTITLEHTSGWAFGDLFAFLDLTRFNDSSQDDSHYGEISPRFSLSKLTGRSFQDGPVTDVLIATTYEFGKGDVEGYLIGPAVDLKLPGFNFLQLNLYQRFTEGDRDGETLQLTPVWSVNLTPRWVFEGYMDWNLTSDDSYRSNLHFNPRLNYDLGSALGGNAGQVYAGLEYSHWQHKYGIEDSAALPSNENALSAMLSVSF